MSALRKIKRVGKKASKFQYVATYQSVVLEFQKSESWKPNHICVSWSRRGRRFITQRRPWQASPDNKLRGVVIWPEKETMEITITLYKSPKDTSYETKEWEFHIIDVDSSGKRKILATTGLNMVRYASTMPFDHDVQLCLKPVSRKVKKVILDITLSSLLLKEGKATDDDMMSIASMMSVSNLSTIGFLEDDDDDNYMWHGGRSITPPPPPENVLSPDDLLKWTQTVTEGYRGVKITNMTTSWRTGMGFLALIHYHRPDLIDIEAVSPNAIKENNKLAFDLAQHLGISCPLNASAMISSTIPDKLLVSSFLYNMHQYFTRAMPSAIAKDSAQNDSASQSPTSGEKSTSPFDISKIHKVFDDPNIYNNLSPVSSPTHLQDMAMNKYSRHSSRRSSATDEPVSEGRPLTVPVGSGFGKMTHTSGSSLVGHSLGHSDTADEFARVTVTESTGQVGGNSGQEDGRSEQEALDAVVLSSGHASSSSISAAETQHESEVRLARVSVESNGYSRVSGRAPEKQSTEEDRLLEFENLRESESEPCTSSSVSLEGFAEGSATSLPSEQPTAASSQRQETASVAIEISQPREVSRLSTGEREKERGGVVHSSSVPAQGVLGREEGRGGLGGNEGDVERRRSEGVQPELNSDSKPHRRLPAIPSDSQEKIVKDEERRQKAKELLKRHRISPANSDIFTSPSTAKSKPVDSKQAKYREQVRLLLNEHLGTPETHRRSVDESDEVADVSASSLLTGLDTVEEMQGRTGEEEEGEGRSQQVEREERKGKHEVAESDVPTSKTRTNHVRNMDVKERDMSPATRRRVGVVDRPQVVVVTSSESMSPTRLLPDPGTVPSSRPRSATAQDVHAAGHGESDTRERVGSEGSQIKRSDAKSSKNAAGPPPKSSSSPPPLRSTGSGQRKKHPVKELKIKPVKSEPSAAARRLMESKKQRATVEMDGEGKGEGEGGGGEGRSDKVQNGHANDESAETKNSSGTAESPSPWNEHNEGLAQDILLTTNEYVRCELGRLQNQLQNMEKRAVEIETDVRHAMTTGNKEEEQAKMQEWFFLLSGKNELIKRQIDLNLIEKEEDLEKRQFFINRELRPLMQLTEEQKTPQQKARADTLLRELLDLVDERDQLERSKMATSRSTAQEREGFVAAQTHTKDIVHGRTGSIQRHGSKDCVIS